MLTPPFGHVLVQTQQPVPGQVYNILYISVRNGDRADVRREQTASTVRLPDQTPASYPILTGDQDWKPGRRIRLLRPDQEVLPAAIQIHSGFEFNLADARSVAIPGPVGDLPAAQVQPRDVRPGRSTTSSVGPGPGAQGASSRPARHGDLTNSSPRRRPQRLRRLLLSGPDRGRRRGRREQVVGHERMPARASTPPVARHRLASATPRPSARPPPRRRRRPHADPVARPRPGPTPIPLPASTVSPAIERFMSQSGRDLPPPPAPDPARLPSRPAPAADRSPAAVRSGDAAPRLPPGPTAAPTAVGDGGPPAEAGPVRAGRPPVPDQPGHGACGSPTPGRWSSPPPRPASGSPRPTLTRAKVLWVPTVKIGADYIRHDGGGPDFNKGIMTAPSVNFFYAGGGLTAIRQPDRRHLRAPGRPPGPQRRATGTSSRPRTTPCCRPPTPTSASTSTGGPTPGRSTPSSRAATWSAGSPASARELVPKVEVDRARNIAGRPGAAGRPGPPGVAGRRAPT